MQEFKSPAKINLRLKVLKRRGDGYHELSMVNGLLSLHDKISLELNDSGSITVETLAAQGQELPAGINDPDFNIAAKAAKLVLSHADSKKIGVDIRIEKNIPIGGGLGGGSSNAATILRYLPQILLDNGKLKESELDFPSRAASLGADIPFFLSKTSVLSYVSGIGEVVEPLSLLNTSAMSLAITLIVPSFGNSTKQVFTAHRIKSEVETDGGISEISDRKLDLNSLYDLIENDLEPAAVYVEPRLADILEVGRSIEGLICGLTGSGSTVFLMSKSRDLRDLEIKKIVAERYSDFAVKIIETNLLA